MAAYGHSLALFSRVCLAALALGAGLLPLAAEPRAVDPRLAVTAQPLPAPVGAAQGLSASERAASAAATAGDAFNPADAIDPEPSFGPQTLARTDQAIAVYEGIVAHGGWNRLPDAARGLRMGQRGPFVVQLKERLAISGDLDNASAVSDVFDAATQQALQRFQARHGLSQTGAVGRLTFAALNVPADVRLKQLQASAARLRNNVFRFERRYVVVNIPGAVVEAIAEGRVERRHVAVVGRKDRPSPVISARINQIVVNPTWTVPNSIIKADMIPAVRKDPAHLFKHNLRTLNWQGQEIDPNTVDWSGKKPINFLLRQDPGPQNSLGQIKIDMPNSEAVYLHDTPKKELFRQDVRFNSSGCARVSDVRDLAAWLLAGEDIDRAEIDRLVAAGQTLELRLKRHVPVAWVYMTAWAASTGEIQFREDIYGLDTPEGIALTTLDGRRRVRPAAPAPMVARAPAADATITGSTRSVAPRREAREPVAPRTAQPARSAPRATAAMAALPRTRPSGEAARAETRPRAAPARPAMARAPATATAAPAPIAETARNIQ
jgi:murein L,D-transpeptidase YcbB/YkuD